MYFYPSQRAWIDDDSPLKLAVKSRQIGFSYCNAYRLTAAPRTKYQIADEKCYFEI